MDPQGRIQQGCPLFSHWLGYDSPDALVGHSLRDLVHPHSTVGADHLLVSHPLALVHTPFTPPATSLGSNGTVLLHGHCTEGHCSVTSVLYCIALHLANGCLSIKPNLLSPTPVCACDVCACDVCARHCSKTRRRVMRVQTPSC